MAYTVFARKYRPQTFDDLAGQEHVARTLSNAIGSERVAHAFLFTGVRNDNNNVGQSIDISLSEIVVYDAGSNALAVASISGHHNANHPNK